MSGPPRRQPSRRPLGSVRTQLVLLFFAITAAAVGFVYLYVVPQLSSSLTAERLERLEQQGSEELAARCAPPPTATWTSASSRRSSGAAPPRSTPGSRCSACATACPSFVIADSELESNAIEPAYPAATGAAISGATRSAVETRPRASGSARPPSRPRRQPAEREHPDWIVVLSTPLDDVEDNVSLIRARS